MNGYYSSLILFCFVFQESLQQLPFSRQMPGDFYITFPLLKCSYITPPLAQRYKREAYRASEFAPRILAQEGLTVLMKVFNSSITKPIPNFISSRI